METKNNCYKVIVMLVHGLEEKLLKSYYIDSTDDINKLLEAAYNESVCEYFTKMYINNIFVKVEKVKCIPSDVK